MGLQDLKDTFFAVLRDRVAAGNAARTCVVRGVVRPAVIVLENELAGVTVDEVPQSDAFCMRWTALGVDGFGMMTARCELQYATAGTAYGGGMDRGRALAAMDEELRAALNSAPQSAALQTVTEVAGGGASTLADSGTRIFWGGVVFGAALIRNERMERTVTVEVFGYE